MKILNIGSMNIDLVYSVDHFVAAGETLASSKLERFSGGKGLNQSIALGRAGAQVFHAGKIGQDGLFLKKMLDDAGVDTGYVSVTDGATGTAIIQVQPDGQNCILLYAGANGEITPGDIDAALKGFQPGDLLLLQNEVSSLEHAIRAAKARGMYVCLNPSPVTDELLRMPLEMVDCFILNEVEAAQIGGGSTPDELLDAMHKRFAQATVVLTLGEEGAVCQSGGECWRQPCYAAKAVDTTAAGDTFTGYFLAAFTAGTSIPEALRRAACAAAIAVSRPGAAPSIPQLCEVEAELKKADGCR